MKLPIHVIAYALSILALGSACQRDDPGAAAKAQASGALAVSAATSLDGLEVVYDVRGTGDTALVFVHCWSCNRGFWRGQVDAFSDSYRVVSLDLGGHGESEATRGVWTVVGLGRDVKAVADALGLNRMILVGHSMGGPVSLEAARLMPGRVLGVIAADTLHDADYVFPPDQAEQMIVAFETDFAGGMSNMFSGMSGNAMEPELGEWILERATGANPEVAVALLRDYTTLDMPGLFSNAGVPIRAVNAPPAEFVPVTNVEGNRKYSDFDATIMDGVGHFLQLERPGEFNAHLRKYVEELASAGK